MVFLSFQNVNAARENRSIIIAARVAQNPWFCAQQNPGFCAESGQTKILALLRMCVGLTPPKKTLTSDQITISYVKLFLNNETSKPTEGEVPPAGCAGGVVCANETNNKKIKL